MLTDQSKLDIGVGTEAPKKLDAKPVEIVTVDIEEQEFSGKKSERLVVMVAHPDKEDAIPIYKIAYLKDTSVKTVGTTIYYDTKGQILMGTAVAELLRISGAPSIRALVGKKIPTMAEASGYLALKAF